MKNSILVLVVVAFVLCVAARADAEIKKSYYDTGQLQYEMNYKGGKMDGETKEYDKSGKLIRVYNYKDDELISATEMRKKSNVNLGPLSFLKSWIFWLVLVVVVGGLWLLFVKVVFRNRPI